VTGPNFLSFNSLDGFAIHVARRPASRHFRIELIQSASWKVSQPAYRFSRPIRRRLTAAYIYWRAGL